MASGPSAASASAPCPCLEVGSGGDIDVGHAETCPEVGGDVAGDVGVVVGGGSQAVVDVDRRDVTPSGDGERDQCGRVGASGEPARHRGARRRKGAPVEEGGGVVQCNASVGDP